MKNVYCAESNKKSIFRFLVFEIWSFIFNNLAREKNWSQKMRNVLKPIFLILEFFLQFLIMVEFEFYLRSAFRTFQKKKCARFFNRKNRKIDYSLVPAHWASFMYIWPFLHIGNWDRAHEITGVWQDSSIDEYDVKTYGGMTMLKMFTYLTTMLMMLLAMFLSEQLIHSPPCPVVA